MAYLLVLEPEQPPSKSNPWSCQRDLGKVELIDLPGVLGRGKMVNLRMAGIDKMSAKVYAGISENREQAPDAVESKAR